MQPPQTKFMAWKLQRTAVNQTRSQHFECFIQKNYPQINFNQSLITNEGFRSDWIEIKCFQVKFLFDWRQSIATFTPWFLSVGGCVVLKTLVNNQKELYVGFHSWWEKKAVIVLTIMSWIFLKWRFIMVYEIFNLLHFQTVILFSSKTLSPIDFSSHHSWHVY